MRLSFESFVILRTIPSQRKTPYNIHLMTAASASTPSAEASKPKHDDPEHYRMSIGDHLEELRWRMIFGLIGFILAAAVCLFFGKRVMSAFCAPMTRTLLERNINPQMVYNEVGEPFMVFIQISLITAAAISAPWMLYQMWMFIATGLYPQERKWVTKYIPLSISLLIAGMLFVYFLVLPWTVQFFVDFGNSIPLPTIEQKIIEQPGPLGHMPALMGDPAKPAEGDFWFNKWEMKIKIFSVGADGAGHNSIIPLLPSSMLAPQISLDKYIDMVVMMLLTFGLSFQLPLLVMALVRIGIVEIPTLKRGRKVVYFILLIAASVITPGDAITATVALAIPLGLLYELGIFLARAPKAQKS
ncbi:MAG TPA: twin-arginine translocase subunit TatC [Tepidisphaeraceae bacterium]|jgi:sec-independent protein translocase protein TatC|nr:twin-arginine translocase subunit TatC [Tepidisphaeraceae bacterium]